jgi:hypothetical protein
MGVRPITCRVCTGVVVEALPIASITGKCFVPHFQHRKKLGLSIARTGSGDICRRYFKNNLVPPCSDPTCLLPPLRTCCALNIPAPHPFDATHPPTSVSGSYRCPEEDGTFTPTLDAGP